MGWLDSGIYICPPPPSTFFPSLSAVFLYPPSQIENRETETKKCYPSRASDRPTSHSLLKGDAQQAPFPISLLFFFVCPGTKPFNLNISALATSPAEAAFATTRCRQPWMREARHAKMYQSSSSSFSALLHFPFICVFRCFRLFVLPSAASFLFASVRACVRISRRLKKAVPALSISFPHPLLRAPFDPLLERALPLGFVLYSLSLSRSPRSLSFSFVLSCVCGFRESLPDFYPASLSPSLFLFQYPSFRTLLSFRLRLSFARSLIALHCVVA